MIQAVGSHAFIRLFLRWLDLTIERFGLRLSSFNVQNLTNDQLAFG